MRTLSVVSAAAGLALVCLAASSVLSTAAAPRRTLARAAWPDTLLARVDGERVTQADLRAAATRFGAHPDSLTPQQAREVLDLLIDQRLLAQRARRESWIWSAQESLTVEQLRDRLIVTAALDSALAAHRAALTQAGVGPLESDTLGVSLRDATVASWNPVWDEALLVRMYRAWLAIPRPTGDMSVMEQIRLAGAMPVLSPADSAATLLRSDVGPMIAGEVLDEWRKLNPIYRPRIEEVEPMRDMAKNTVFERELRRRATQMGLEQRPDIAAQLTERREYLAIQHFVQREVYDDMPRDSATLARHFASKPSAWRLQGYARVFQMVLDSRAGAEQLLERVRAAADVETLMVRWNKRDDARQARSFIRTVSAQHDSAMYALALRLGTGAIAGPDSLQGGAAGTGWRILRVMETQEPRDRTFAEALTLVHKDWTESEGERRMRRLLDRLRQGAKVELSPALATSGVRR